MNKKPIDVLNEQINVYKKFIASVESEKNIEVSKEQVEKIICDARLKITEFEDAVKILSEETRKDFDRRICEHHFIGELNKKTNKYELTCEFCGELKASSGKNICIECGNEFERKDIIINGDSDTCDDCLCPE